MNYLDKLKHNKTLIIAFCILVILSIIKNISQSEKNNESIQDTIDISTHIPKGYVLLPIDFINSEQLKSLIQNFGYIDLYMINSSGQKNKVAEKLKILRAPYNPNVFAVLVKESDSEFIMQLSGPFEGAIQNNQIATERVFVKKSPERIHPVDINFYKNSELKSTEAL